MRTGEAFHLKPDIRAALLVFNIGLAHHSRSNGRARHGDGCLLVFVILDGQYLALGGFYTTYVLWAVAPEGQAENLMELPIQNNFKIESTTKFQTFGLIITAE
ncbi:MAG: hypothetical protein ABIP14_11740, partial [Blastocatellia bacterium]